VEEPTKEIDAQPECILSSPKSNHIAFAPASAHVVFWFIFVVGLLLDLWSKAAVFEWLGDDNRIYPVIDGFLRIVTAVNAGAAFGIAAGMTSLLIGVSIVALIVVLAVFIVSGREDRITHVALGLFAAGVAGNLYDRMFNDGLVRDFIDVTYWPGKHWPAFNVADSMLCVAVALLVIPSAANLLKNMLSHKNRRSRGGSEGDGIGRP
jgi:signal peptidase II